MSEWKQKRFWTAAAVAPVEGGFAVELDGRGVKTPAKSPLVLPTRALAEAVAGEWAAQVDEVRPLTMPFTRSANAAIDKVRVQKGEVADMLAAYGDADLVCYRAEGPQELVDRQCEHWDPVLDWAEGALGARLEPRQGVMHAAQDTGAQETLRKAVHRLSSFQLAAFHDLVSLSGSLVLGFAAARGWRDIDDIWRLSRLDESWQEEQWGPDDEASELAEIKRQSFLHAKRFFDFA
jgi:chaperone required for assembly of F1-ATPase